MLVQIGRRHRIMPWHLFQFAQILWRNIVPILEQSRKLRAIREAAFICNLFEGFRLAFAMNQIAVRQIQTLLPDQLGDAIILRELSVQMRVGEFEMRHDRLGTQAPVAEIEIDIFNNCLSH